MAGKLSGSKSYTALLSLAIVLLRKPKGCSVALACVSDIEMDDDFRICIATLFSLGLSAMAQSTPPAESHP